MCRNKWFVSFTGRTLLQLLGCDEKFFKQVVKTAFNQRRKTLRNALKPLLKEPGLLPPEAAALLDLRAERLGVEDFILLTKALSAP